MTKAFIGLGSNLGHPEKQLAEALASLDGTDDVCVKQNSSFYRSKPVGPQDQPDYINAVARLETDLDPLDLLDRMQAIEDRQGRVRGKVRWGPRTLDLDLLLYGDKIINKKRLTVPHPEIKNRDFVLIPLNEIAPDLVIPVLGPISELLIEISHAGLDRLE
ncbi:MAG: 2-amino-4-hydroxy-6-hydroxymethyldihydropteridine diphosphokinase [Gammaproteobacteria bacterium]